MTERQGVLDRMADFGRAMIGGLGALSCQRPKVTLGVWVLLSVLAGWYSADNLTMSTSTSDMIAPDTAFRQHTEEYRQAFPFADDVIDFVLDHDQVFVIEQNRDAQLRMLLINEGALDPARLISVLHYDGTPITARFITREIARRWAFLTGKNSREAAE